MSKVKSEVTVDESIAFLSDNDNDIELKIVKNSQKIDEIETTVASKEINNHDNESNAFVNKNNIQLKIQQKTDKNVNTKSNDDDYDCYEDYALCISCFVCLFCNWICGVYVIFIYIYHICLLILQMMCVLFIA